MESRDYFDHYPEITGSGRTEHGNISIEIGEYPVEAHWYFKDPQSLIEFAEQLEDIGRDWEAFEAGERAQEEVEQSVQT